MNGIARIRERVFVEFPTAFAEIDAPRNPDGFWYLDIQLGYRYIIVEWRPKHGLFGIADCSHETDRVFCDSADVVYTNLDEAVAKVFELLRK